MMKTNDQTDVGKKLVLDKETIRQLDDVDLEPVAGGTALMPTSEQPRCTRTLCNDG